MKKLSQEKLVEIMVGLTREYTKMYFLTGHTKMDRSNLAALYLGFMTGMKQNGYSDQELGEALELAKKELSNDD